RKTERFRLLAFTFIVIVIVAILLLFVVIYFPAGYPTYRRGKFVGWAFTVSAFIGLPAIVGYNLRVIWQPDATSEVSITCTVSKFLGAGGLFVYGIFYKHPYIAARHGILFSMHGLVLAVLGVHSYRARSRPTPT
ncbi:hypothetical protein LINGRAHAP2_LOCUS17473, partial [Linum grandiflorum]